MPSDEQVSRYDINRKVRMVFTRHDADLTRIDYSFMGSTVYLNGDLVRLDGDFSASEIELFIREIASLPHVHDIQFDLNNWLVIHSGDSWKITRTRKSAVTRATGQPGTAGDSTVVIDKVEDLVDVLDELNPNSKKDADHEKNQPK
jgi:hypothetical protein